MKKLSAVLFAAVLVLNIICPVFADDINEGQCGDNIQWSFDGGLLTLNGSGEMTDYSEDCPAPWYDFSTDITSIDIGSGITSIGSYAFTYCGIEKLVLPNTVTTVGDNSFSNCISLKTVTSKKGLVSIGYEAFSGCYSLKTVTVPGTVTTLGDYCFSGCSALSSFAFPDRLFSVGRYSFVGCSALTSVSLPPYSLISEGSFEGCTALKNVTLPRYLTEVPEYAFFGCYSLETVKFGAYLEKINEEAFLSCEGYKSARLPSSLKEVADHALGYYYFDGEYIKYPDFSVASVGGIGEEFALENGFEHIFDSDDHICSHKCPFCDKCTDNGCICLNCSDKCDGHTFPITGICGENLVWELYENGSMVVSGDGSMTDFSYNNVPWAKSILGIKKLTVEDGVTTIGSYAFSECINLTDITLSQSVSELHNKAFFRSGAVKVAAPGVINIGRLVFAYSPLKEISAELCETVGGYAFQGCSSLSGIVLNNVTSVGNGAFEDCPLATITVPYSLAAVGDRAIGYYFSDDRILKMSVPPVITYKNSYKNPVFYEETAYTEQYGEISRSNSAAEKSDGDSEYIPLSGCADTFFPSQNSLTSIVDYIRNLLSKIASVIDIFKV